MVYKFNLFEINKKDFSLIFIIYIKLYINYFFYKFKIKQTV